MTFQKVQLKLKDTDNIETRRLQIKGLYNCLTNKYIEDGE